MLVAALSGQTDALFNLNCAGVQAFDDEISPFVSTIRIDLEARVWCADGCPVGRQIAAVSPEVISLIDEPSREGHGVRMARSMTIDRASLRFSASYRFVGAGIETGSTDALCQLAPFSGIPAERP